MRRRWHIALIIALAATVNYVVAGISTRWQPLLLHEEGTTATMSELRAELVRQHPAVLESEIEPVVMEVRTGLGRRIATATGFDEGYYIAGPKTDANWVSFRYGSACARSLDAEYFGVHESRQIIPIIYVRISSGWPFPALSTNLVSDQDPMKGRRDFYRCRIAPIVPIFPGFLLNTAIYFLPLLLGYLIVVRRRSVADKADDGSPC